MLDRIFSGGSHLVPILLRWIVGVVGIVHGWPKIRNLQSFIDSVGQAGIPIPHLFATAAALSEFLGGIALIVGLFARQAAFLFGCVMAVAVFKIHWANGFLASNKGFEYPLVLLVICLSLMMTGAGPFSLDRSVRGQK